MEKYRGMEIKIDGEKLYIDGKQIEFSKINDKFSSNELPYSSFQSLLDLAKNIIDSTK